jgi:hypothetical protein
MKVLAIAMLLGLGAPMSTPVEGPALTPVQQSCCKRCSAGKPCGDSCIARSKSCSKAPGCACQG